MNKAYIIGPLVGLLVFGAIYWNFSQGFAEKVKLEETRKVEERRARILREAEQHKKAIEEANAAALKRKAERAAKEKKDEEERLAHQDLVDRRSRAFDDVNKRLRPQVDRLKLEADDVKAEIATLDMQKKQYLDEETFLRTFVRTAEANAKTYYDLLDKLAEAEKKRAEAEAAAARAAAKAR
jgi:hypothetical protein